MAMKGAMARTRVENLHISEAIMGNVVSETQEEEEEEKKKKMDDGLCWKNDLPTIMFRLSFLCVSF